MSNHTKTGPLREALRKVRDVDEWSRQNGDPLFKDETVATLADALHVTDTGPTDATWLTDAIRESLDANNAFEYDDHVNGTMTGFDGNKDVMAEAIAHDIAESFARAALHVTDTPDIDEALRDIRYEVMSGSNAATIVDQIDRLRAALAARPDSRYGDSTAMRDEQEAFFAAGQYELGREAGIREGILRERAALAARPAPDN